MKSLVLARFSVTHTVQSLKNAFQTVRLITRGKYRFKGSMDLHILHTGIPWYDIQ